MYVSILHIIYAYFSSSALRTPILADRSTETVIVEGDAWTIGH